MKIHESGENYLEAILMLKLQNGSVRAIDIVNTLGFSKPSVSVAMKNLEADGYIERDCSGHISLLPKGQVIAEKTYEKHMALVKILKHMGVDSEIAEKDACRIEHHLSDATFDAIKSYCKNILD